MAKHIRIKLTEIEYKLFGCLAVIEDVTRKDTVQRAFDEFLERREMMARNGQAVVYRALPLEGSWVTAAIPETVLEDMQRWAAHDNVRVGAVYSYAVTEFLREQKEDLNMEALT